MAVGAMTVQVAASIAAGEAGATGSPGDESAVSSPAESRGDSFDKDEEVRMNTTWVDESTGEKERVRVTKSGHVYKFNPKERSWRLVKG